MKKCIFAAVLAAATFAAQATPNTFVAADNRAYSVADVREINLAPGGFQLTYIDGNVSDVFADANYTLLAKVLTAPALANVTRVGTTGQYLNTDEIKKAQCQVGGGIPEVPAVTGNYTLVYWQKSGYTLVTDAGCGFFSNLKAGSIK